MSALHSYLILFFSLLLCYAPLLFDTDLHNRLLRTFTRERALIRSLVELGLTRRQAIEFVMHPVQSGPVDLPPPTKSNRKVSKGTTQGSAKRFVDTDTDVGAVTFDISPKWNDLLDGLVDSSDRLEGGSVIVWWNNIEEDTRYTGWGTDLTQVDIYTKRSFPGYANFFLFLLPVQLLRTHPSQLFSPFLRLRVNVINAVLALDFSQPRFFPLLATQVENIVSRGFPVRWGFVPVAADDGDGA